MKCRGKKDCKCETATLDGEKVEYREGALRRQLGLRADQKFTRAQLDRLKKVDVGSMFTLFGKRHKMTTLMKQRVSLGRTLMGKGGATKGAASKPRPGDKDYTTKRGDKDFHEAGRDVRKGRKPFRK